MQHADRVQDWKSRTENWALHMFNCSQGVYNGKVITKNKAEHIV